MKDHIERLKSPKEIEAFSYPPLLHEVKLLAFAVLW